MHQEKPKSLCFLLDVSGSMYRFNGQDQRLDRLLQTALMLMEGLEGFELLTEADAGARWQLQQPC